ncbi:MAG: hypothetical protein Q4G40_04455 [Brachybacterium sp.]|nr:hypothetical protein [Brachybacterium sp.]
MTWRERIVRPLYALIGVTVLGVGVGILIIGVTGVDPYSVLTVGLSARTGYGLGPVQIVVNLVLLIPVAIWGRRMIGLGTIINMVLTGFVIAGTAALLAPLAPAEPTMLSRAGFLLLGMLVFDLGVSAYVAAGLGGGPYDAIAPLIVDRTGWAYRYVRGVQDIAVAALGFILGGPLGIATVITAFFNGPLIELMTRLIHTPLVARLTATEPIDVLDPQRR